MKEECITCGGSGQVGFFQGVSRFLITWEECPDCCGTGFIEPDTKGPHNGAEKPEDRKKTSGRKKKR